MSPRLQVSHVGNAFCRDDSEPKLEVCRRWATIPVVKVAQLEKTVEFPPELVAPWPYLQRNFGVTADSGNNTANVLLNFNERGERVYKINVGMSDRIRSSEEVFFRMFYNLEVLVCIELRLRNLLAGPLLTIESFQGIPYLL